MSMAANESKKPRRSAREKLLEAALQVVREKGYAATSVDELCRRAEVTKGAFFHHFASKTALAVAAAEHWSEITGALFAEAPYHAPADPLQRVLAYIDFRKALLDGALPEVTCLVGTMTQETYAAEPEIRDACARSIFGHADTLEADFAEAVERYGVSPPHGPASLARHSQAVIQGAFILAKASGDVAIAAESLDHLRRYIELLFQPANGKGAEHV